MAEQKKKMNLTMIVLVAVLVLAVGYIGVTEYTNWKRSQDIRAYQQGYQQGMNDTATQIANTAAQCQTIPMNVGENQTVTLVSVRCYQQAMQQQAQQTQPQSPQQPETQQLVG